MGRRYEEGVERARKIDVCVYARGCVCVGLCLHCVLYVCLHFFVHVCMY